MLRAVGAVHRHRPVAGVAAVVELIAQLGAGDEGQLAGGALDHIPLRISEGESVPAHVVGAVDQHRLVAARRRIRGRRQVADRRCSRRRCHRPNDRVTLGAGLDVGVHLGIRTDLTLRE